MSTIILYHSGPSTDNCYVLLYNSSGQVWNGTSFVTYSSGSHSTYAVALTNSGNVWTATHPSVPLSTYTYVFYLRAGGSPVSTDQVIANSVATLGDGTTAAGVTVSAQAYMTLSELKAYLKVDDTTNDALLQSLINFGSEYLDKIMNRKIKKHWALLNITGGVKVYELLPSIPVIDVKFVRTGYIEAGELSFQSAPSPGDKYMVSFDARNRRFRQEKYGGTSPTSVTFNVADGGRLSAFATQVNSNTALDFTPVGSGDYSDWLLSLKQTKMGVDTGYETTAKMYMTSDFVEYDLLNRNAGVIRVRSTDVEDGVLQVGYEAGLESVPYDLKMVLVELVYESLQVLVVQDPGSLDQLSNPSSSTSYSQIVAVDKVRTENLGDYGYTKDADKILTGSVSSGGSSASSSNSFNLMQTGMRVVAKHAQVITRYTYVPVVIK